MMYTWSQGSVQLVVRSDRLLSSPPSSSSRIHSHLESAEGALCSPQCVQKHFCRREGEQGQAALVTEESQGSV